MVGRNGTGIGQGSQGWDPSLWQLETLQLRGLTLLLEPPTGRVFSHPTAPASPSDAIPGAAAWPAPLGMLSTDGVHLLDAVDVFTAYAPLHGLPEDAVRRSQLQVHNLHTQP